MALGQAARGKPAFFTITPAVAGTYRWSGTTILIFTPAKRLPLATNYDVTIAATAAVSGRKLAAPYTFSFTTPTVKLLQTNWYRPGGRFDAAPIVVLRFNQPVKPEDVLAHVRAAFERHPYTPPVIPQPVAARLRAVDPAAAQAFTDKVQRARGRGGDRAGAARAGDGLGQEAVPAEARHGGAAGDDAGPARKLGPDSDRRPRPSLAGLAASGRPQNYTIKVEPAFFVDDVPVPVGLRSRQQQPIQFTSR